MLFDTQRPAITKHLNNIFNSGELDRTSTCSILEHMGNDGKQRYVRSQANSMSGLLQTLPKEHLLSLYCKIKNLDPTIKE